MRLEVSKLSGWLNADALCPGAESRTEGIRCGMRYAGREAGGGGRRRATAVHAERTLNIQLMSATLEVSKLSGWLNANAACSVERRSCAVWCEVQRTGRQEVVDDRGARSVQGRARL